MPLLAARIRSLRDLVDLLIDVWLHDNSPSSERDVPSRNDVGGSNEATRRADEVLSITPIFRAHVPTRWTRAACVSRINDDQRDAGLLRFVGDEHPELRERPVTVARPLVPANRCPASDVSRIFEGESSAGAFGLAHQSLAYDVVGVTLESRLPPSYVPELATCRSLKSLLKIPASMLISTSLRLNGRAGVNDGVGIGCDICDSQIDAKEVVDRRRNWFLDVKREQEEEHSASVDEIGFTSSTPKPRFLFGAESNADSLAPRKSHQADSRRRLPRQDAIVVRDRTSRSEAITHARVVFRSLCNFADGVNGDLSRESKLRADLVIGKAMKLPPGRGAMHSSDLSNKVRRGVASLHRQEKLLRLPSGWFEADAGRQFRTDVLSRRLVIDKPLGTDET